MSGQTKGGKIIDIVPVPGYALWKIQFRSGGRQPKEFNGSFTSKLAATQAMESYLARSK